VATVTGFLYSHSANITALDPYSVGVPKGEAAEGDIVVQKYPGVSMYPWEIWAARNLDADGVLLTLSP
jgi:hypothetical protein